MSPKVTVFPSTLKKTLSEKDKEGQSSVQSGGSATHKTTQEVRSASDSDKRSSPFGNNSEDHGSMKTKEKCSKPDKDKAAGKKSSASGEEADKDFILI